LQRQAWTGACMQAALYCAVARGLARIEHQQRTAWRPCAVPACCKSQDSGISESPASGASGIRTADNCCYPALADMTHSLLPACPYVTIFGFCRPWSSFLCRFRHGGAASIGSFTLRFTNRMRDLACPVPESVLRVRHGTAAIRFPSGRCFWEILYA
jgi:hypothetical protein